jgi:hypothetical protein
MHDNKCPDCGYESIDVKDWNQHRRQAHGNYMPFSCSSCHYKGCTEIGLQDHKCKSVSRAKFSCDQDGCEFKSKSKSHLLFHKLMMHSETDKHSCRVCRIVCYSKENLLRHMRGQHTVGEARHVPYSSCNGRELSAGFEDQISRGEGKLNECLINVHQQMMNSNFD